MNNISNSIIIINSEYVHISEDNTILDLEQYNKFNMRLMPKTRNGTNTIRLFTNQIYDSLNLNTPERLRERKLSAIENVISNVVEAHITKSVVAVHRGKAHYKAWKRRGYKHYTFNIMTNVFDSLIEAGYIDQKVGYNNRVDGTSKTTRIWATPKLLEALEIINPPISSNTLISDCMYNDSISFTFDELPLTNKVIKRGSKYKLPGTKKKVADEVFYFPTKESNSMNDDLKQYNSLMDKVYVSMPIDKYAAREVYDDTIDSLLYNRIDSETMMIYNANGSVLGALTLECKFGYDDISCYTFRTNTPSTTNTTSSINEYSKLYEYDQMYSSNGTSIPTQSRHTAITSPFSHNPIQHRKLRTSLYRVFNNGSFNEGGRFYGAEYQQYDSDIRSSIEINNYPTVECDYKALHPSMLFNQHNLTCPDDPYDLYDSNPLLRKAVKLMFNIAINANKEDEAIKAFNDSLKKNFPVHSELFIKSLKAKDILNRIKQEYPLFNKYICTGYGLKLQNKDSMMAAEILNHFTKQNIPCLCIHDSFIVQFQHEEELRDVMKSTYSKYNNGYECVVETK